MHRSYRRVVTGHDKNGAAIIESDQVATQTWNDQTDQGKTDKLWITDQTPAEYDGPTETCLGPLTLNHRRGVQYSAVLNSCLKIQK